jgi:hypothetical protein
MPDEEGACEDHGLVGPSSMAQVVKPKEQTYASTPAHGAGHTVPPPLADATLQSNAAHSRTGKPLQQAAAAAAGGLQE